VKLVRVPKVPHPPSDGRGWHTEAVEAWEGERSIGMLKVSWIPADAMAERYPTVERYARGIAGYESWGPLDDSFLDGLRPRFEEFRALQSQPFVAYVDVEEDRRRRGVALALYREAAVWLTERGLSLAASDTQTEQVRALWGRLRGLDGLVSLQLPDGRWSIRAA
jgi:GNAT superfamily N-acetyltransferase